MKVAWFSSFINVSRLKRQFWQKIIYYNMRLKLFNSIHPVKMESECLNTWSVYAVWLIYWFKSIDWLKFTSFHVLGHLIFFNSLELHELHWIALFMKKIDSKTQLDFSCWLWHSTTFPLLYECCSNELRLKSVSINDLSFSTNSWHNFA